jgi:uncharacterized membrane protein
MRMRRTSCRKSAFVKSHIISVKAQKNSAGDLVQRMDITNGSATKDSIPGKVGSITHKFSMLEVVVMLWVSSNLGLTEPFHFLNCMLSSLESLMISSLTMPNEV